MGVLRTISLDEIAVQAKTSGRTSLQVMCSCLEQGIWPLRFVRNSGVFSAEQQRRLLSSKAAIIGCGGLGGHVATLLTRAGVGSLALCDGDAFSESNLNRQQVCRESNLGCNKAEAAAAEVAALASHVTLRVYPENLTAQNADAILLGADIALDCLDSIPARLLLQKQATALGLTLIHAAIAGEEGFFALVSPGADTLQRIYESGANDAEGTNRDNREQISLTAEAVLGVPTTTPAVIAAFQATLALQALTGKELPPPALHHLDLSALTLETFRL
ncbi:MAG: ThiF family adenylyltransferase [Deltaproteobacteria bacterium]|jgi:molybdopterin/thiamine biosynthesis adenylyltransferase|nr:ThiF family adenylyltransferase [Deltaproteobacteria bacterium]